MIRQLNGRVTLIVFVHVVNMEEDTRKGGKVP